MPFKKGVSGNPNGRPKKGGIIVSEMMKEIGNKHKGEKTYYKIMLEKLWEQAMKGDPHARTCLLDRMLGKPVTPTADVSEVWKEFISDVFVDKEE